MKLGTFVLTLFLAFYLPLDVNAKTGENYLKINTNPTRSGKLHCFIPGKKSWFAGFRRFITFNRDSRQEYVRNLLMEANKFNQDLSHFVKFFHGTNRPAELILKSRRFLILWRKYPLLNDLIKDIRQRHPAPRLSIEEIVSATKRLNKTGDICQRRSKQRIQFLNKKNLSEKIFSTALLLRQRVALKTFTQKFSSWSPVMLVSPQCHEVKKNKPFIAKQKALPEVNHIHSSPDSKITHKKEIEISLTPHASAKKVLPKISPLATRMNPPFFTETPDTPLQKDNRFQAAAKIKTLQKIKSLTTFSPLVPMSPSLIDNSLSIQKREKNEIVENKISPGPELREFIFYNQLNHLTLITSELFALITKDAESLLGRKINEWVQKNPDASKKDILTKLLVKIFHTLYSYNSNIAKNYDENASQKKLILPVNFLNNIINQDFKKILYAICGEQDHCSDVINSILLQLDATATSITNHALAIGLAEDWLTNLTNTHQSMMKVINDEKFDLPKILQTTIEEWNKYKKNDAYFIDQTKQEVPWKNIPQFYSEYILSETDSSSLDLSEELIELSKLHQSYQLSASAILRLASPPPIENDKTLDDKISEWVKNQRKDYPQTVKDDSKPLSNFGVVLPGLTRSGWAGSDLRDFIQNFNIQSVIFMHIDGYKDTGSTKQTSAIAEKEITQSLGKHFLTSFDQGVNRAYIDAQDPRGVDVKMNVFNPDTVKKSLGEKARSFFNTNAPKDEDQSYSYNYNGDLLDVFLTLSNIDATPFPLHMHCLGGRHKTSMLMSTLLWMVFGQENFCRHRSNYEHNVAWGAAKNELYQIKHANSWWDYALILSRTLTTYASPPVFNDIPKILHQQYFQYTEDLPRETNVNFLLWLCTHEATESFANIPSSFIQKHNLKSFQALKESLTDKMIRMINPDGPDKELAPELKNLSFEKKQDLLYRYYQQFQAEIKNPEQKAP